MESKLTLLRNALLVTLVIMLVYVLYKRLLSFIRSQEVRALHPAIETSFSDDAEKATIALITPNRFYVIIKVVKENGELQKVVFEGEIDAGKHEFSFLRSELAAGRYYYKISTPNEESSHYFSI